MKGTKSFGKREFSLFSFIIQNLLILGKLKYCNREEFRKIR